jgi:cytochrome c oxidase assembly protein subunit 16
MAVFENRKYRSAAESNSLGARYRAMMAKRPFLMFGLPFMSVIVAASFVLTPATAIRYERHDRKVRQMTREEELGLGKAGRKVDLREEYYVRVPLFSLSSRLPYLAGECRDLPKVGCMRCMIRRR